MTPTDQHHDHDDHNATTDHEHSDVNVRTVLIAAVALAAVVAVAALAMWGVFRLFERQAAANDPQLSPLAVPSGQLPPEPRLQTNEYAGLKKAREAEAKTLENYGWVDQKSGVAHMPIEDAKKLLLQRGLPARAGNTDPLLGTHVAAYGEANGGRALARPPVSR